MGVNRQTNMGTNPLLGEDLIVHSRTCNRGRLRTGGSQPDLFVLATTTRGEPILVPTSVRTKPN